MISSCPTEMEMDLENEETGAEAVAKPAPARRWLGPGILLPVIIAVAAAGFGLGRVGVMTLAPAPQDSPAILAPQAHAAGRFAIAVNGSKITFVDAIVLVDGGDGSPQNPAQLRDAVLGLLTQAAALPLVQHADDTLKMLERSTMAMATETAPWLAGLKLELPEQ